MELKILLATPSPGALAPFSAALSAEKDVKLLRVDNAQKTLDTAASSRPDLVVLDERIRDMDTLEIIKRLLMVDAGMYVACVSALSHDDFHEHFEGLGVLTQLSPQAGPKEAKSLMGRLTAIKKQMAGVQAGAIG